MCLSGSGLDQTRDEAQGGLVMPAVAERSGRAVLGWRWSTAQESTSPDGPPLGQQPPETVCWPRHNVKAKTSTQRVVALTPWLRGVERERFLSSSPCKPPPSLPAVPASARRCIVTLAAGALLPAGSTANRLLLGSDLPRAHLGGADALEHVGPPAGSQSRAPVAGSSWLSSWASPSWSYCNQAWRRSMWVTRDPSRRAICSRSVRLQHRRRTLWR